MKHQSIQKHLSAYLDNELAPPLREKVNVHLRECEECKMLLADFSENQQRIADLVHPVPSMKDVILTKIQEMDVLPRERFVSVFKRWLFRPFTVGATAFSTVCILVAVFFFTYSPAPQSDGLLDFYFGLQSEQAEHSPLKSNVASPISDPPTYTEDFSEDTETLLNLYLGD